MGYKLTHKLHALRRDIRRSPKGSLKKMVIAMGIGMACSVVWCTGIGSYTDTAAMESMYRLRGNRLVPKEVVLVAIDDSTYRELEVSPRHPFPRGVFADALARIHTDKPSVIILDLFAPKDSEDPRANEKLRAALASGPSVIARVQVTNPLRGANQEPDAVLFSSDDMFRKAASMELRFAVRTVNKVAYHISLVDDPKAPEYNRVPLLAPLRKYVDRQLEAPDVRDLINFYGPSGTIPRVSLARLFSEKDALPQGYFKNKVVFVGFQSILRERGYSDKELLNVPLRNKEMFGLEIHANIGANLIDGSWLRRLPFEVEQFLITILSFFLFLGIISARPGPAFAYLIAFLCVWYAASYFAFVFLNMFIPGVFLLLVVAPLILCAAAIITAISALRTLRETQEMLGLGQS